MVRQDIGNMREKVLLRQDIGNMREKVLLRRTRRVRTRTTRTRL